VLIATATGLSRSVDRGATFTKVAAITEPLQRLSGTRTIYAIGGQHFTYHATMSCGSCVNASYETLSLYRSTDLGRTWERRALDDPHGGATNWGATAVPAPPATPPRRLGSNPVGGPTPSPPWPGRTLATGARGEVYAGSISGLYASADGAAFGKRTGAPIVVTAAGTLLDTATGRSTDGGASWTSPPAADDERKNIFSMTVTPDGRAFATGMGGVILARDATGAWRRVRNPATERLTQIFALDNDRIIAVGDAGTILVSVDRGLTFALRPSGTTEHLNAVWGVGKTVLVAGSGDDRGQVVLRSTDGGATWKRLPGLGSDAGISLWGSAIDDVYMVTINGGRMHSSDGGATWKDVGKGLDGVIVGVWGTGVGDVYMIGWDGRLFHTFDRGKTWQRVALKTKDNLRAIWGRSAKDIYIAAGGDHDAGTLLHTTDGGATWREEPHPIATPIFGLAGDARSVYILGTGGRIARD
jgi:photosystem II stability/assembly factor-like uncharacterized protein